MLKKLLKNKFFYLDLTYAKPLIVEIGIRKMIRYALGCWSLDCTVNSQNSFAYFNHDTRRNHNLFPMDNYSIKFHYIIGNGAPKHRQDLLDEDFYPRLVGYIFKQKIVLYRKYSLDQNPTLWENKE